jgi:hypothetical protein
MMMMMMTTTTTTTMMMMMMMMMLLLLMMPLLLMMGPMLLSMMNQMELTRAISSIVLLSTRHYVHRVSEQHVRVRLHHNIPGNNNRSSVWPVCRTQYGNTCDVVRLLLLLLSLTVFLFRTSPSRYSSLFQLQVTTPIAVTWRPSACAPLRERLQRTHSVYGVVARF